MSRRQVLLMGLILTNVSIGFTQSLGDFAREERARQNSFAVATVPANAAVKPDVPKTSVEVAKTADISKPADAPKTAEGSKSVADAPKAVNVPKPVEALNPLVTEALRVSGAKRQLEEAIETFRPSVAGGKLADEALGLDRLTQVMGRSVSAAVRENTLTNIVGFYGSPLGRKLAAAEVNVYNQDMPARFQRYAAQLQEKAPEAGRRELVESIGAAGLGVPRPPVEVDSDSWLLFLYDSLSDVELSNYLRFLNSPSASAFNTAVWDGIDAAFGDASQQLQDGLAKKQ